MIQESTSRSISKALSNSLSVLLAKNARTFHQRVLQNPHIPHKPTVRQALFLLHDHVLEVLYGGAAGGGKLLALDTPLPTPHGWVSVDNVQVGDVLFDERGQQCRVLALSAIDPNPKCYRVTFDDGSTVDACADHRWLTYNASELSKLTRYDPEWRRRRREKRPSRAKGTKSKYFTQAITERNKLNPNPCSPPPTGTVRTTQDIADTLLTPRGRRNHAIPIAGAIECPDADLLVDPYVLGAWLGDGTSAGGGLMQKLRALGVRKNKHVPQQYLRGSYGQRLALLQGLMDTDGHAALDGGCEFDNTNKRLVEAVYELVVSLGIKATLQHGKAKLNGRIIGDKWRVKFTTNLPVFRLPRKLARINQVVRRTQKLRYVVACDLIPSVPMRCIAVDSPSRLFLCGKSMIPTHNSDALLMAAAMYVDCPHYSALILRRTYADLALPGAIMDRAISWWRNRNGVRWNQQEKKFTFPSGATISFGYLQTAMDRFRYQSAEFQAIFPDELTQFSEAAYTYLFSRLRGNKKTAGIPLRMRPATNPPATTEGIWVKGRFLTKDCLMANKRDFFGNVWWKDSRAFVPASILDNPHLNAEDYRKSLAEMDVITRKQLEEGDWSAHAAGRFNRNWFPTYRDAGDALILGKGYYGPDNLVPKSQLAVSFYIDPANRPKRDSKNTVIHIGGQDNRARLFVLDVICEKMSLESIVPTLYKHVLRWQSLGLSPQQIGIEANGFQLAICNEARDRDKYPRMPFILELQPEGKSKLTRATPAINKAFQGEIYVPESDVAWKDNWFSELELFTGDDTVDVYTDQVDTLAYNVLDLKNQYGFVATATNA